MLTNVLVVLVNNVGNFQDSLGNAKALEALWHADWTRKRFGMLVAGDDVRRVLADFNLFGDDEQQGLSLKFAHGVLDLAALLQPTLQSLGNSALSARHRIF